MKRGAGGATELQEAHMHEARGGNEHRVMVLQAADDVEEMTLCDPEAWAQQVSLGSMLLSMQAQITPCTHV
eukprot:1162015-Pelagomonas_calceolata.AAC.15